MKKTIAVLSAVALVSGCAGANYRPLVDSRGVDAARYEADLRQCQQYATQVANAQQQAVAGALAGAVIGVAFAAIIGHGVSRDTFAGVGALDGGLVGAAQGETDQRNVIRRCMGARGYSVLN